MVALYWLAAPEIIMFVAFVLGLVVVATVCIVAVIVGLVQSAMRAFL